jgi:isoamylase
MTEEEWHAGWVRCLALQLSGKTLDHINAMGQPVKDDTFLFMMNPHHESIKFYLPRTPKGSSWKLLLDTRSAEAPPEVLVPGGEPYDLLPHSSALFSEVEPA